MAVVVSTSGHSFYPCLRVGITLLLPMLVHGLWDFSLISNSVGADPELSPAMILPVLLQVVLIVVLLARRRSIAPAIGSASSNGPTPAEPALGA
ncbi:hypothetical protein ACGFYA_18165 [Streptomyces sp. NPDC048305]|uniref:hypothetical protein n=1 Tax=Streptomyces sp. NPDC048305 TaxID=3365532 RepID=UPI00371BDB5D